MTTKQKWGLVLALVAIAAIWYFWDDISKLWKSDDVISPKDGDTCTDTNGNTSTYLNGVCQEIIRPNPNGGTGNNNSASRRY